MESYKTKLFTQPSINAVFLTGIMSFLMHPFVLFGYNFPDLGFLVWIYLVPLILGIHRYSLKHKIILCFLCSMIGHYGVFYWLMTAMQRYGHLNFFESFATMTLLFIVLSLVFAIFLAFACWINHLIKLPFFFILPLFMVAHDVALHHIPFHGFPWNIPVYTQREWIQFFQWIDVTGIFGLSFFIYLINGLFADAFLLFIHRKQLDKMVSRLLIIFVLVLLSLYGSFLSNRNYENTKVSKGTINIALAQGNISQDIKWDPFRAQDNLNAYLQLTHLAVKEGADVVIWPETAYPYGVRLEKMHEEKFLDKEQLLAPILFGAIVSQSTLPKKELYNSVVLADTDAHLKAVYRKIHLVPFGEYLPLKEWLGYLKALTENIGEFTKGMDYTLFDIEGFKLAPLICFEDIFPKYSRIFSNKSADILFNVTNDAWYGDSSAQYQHLVFSQFRALENRRYLVRATNTGLTAIINPRGEVVDQLEPFKAGYLIQNIKVDRAMSYYTKHGDQWVNVVLVLCALVFVYTVIKRWLGPVKLEF